MNINPLDILLVVFLFITIFIGYKNRAIIEFKKTVSLLGSIMLSNMIINSLSKKIYFLQSRTDIFYLSAFLIIFILIILAVSFIFDMIIEESDEMTIDKYILNMAYKKNYRPAEIFLKGQWSLFEKDKKP